MCKKKFVYKSSPKDMFFSLIFCLFVLIWVIFEISTLEYKEVNFFHVVFIFFSFVMLATAVVLITKIIYRSMYVHQEIIVSDNSIVCPKNMISNKTICIDFMDVTDLYTESLGNQLSIIIVSKKERLIISEILLEDRKTFNFLFKIIKDNVELLKVNM